MRGCVILTLLIATTAQATDYWPQDLGASWRYRIAGGYEFELSILDFTYPCLEPCRVRTNGELASEYYAGELFVVNEDGDVYLAGLLHAGNDYSFWDCYSEPVLFLDLPLEVGKTWTDSTTDAIVSAEVTGESQIITPAGEFSCFVVSHMVMDLNHFMPFNRTFWLNAQLGPVRIGDAELVSYDGIVPAETVTWGAVKSLYGDRRR